MQHFVLRSLIYAGLISHVFLADYLPKFEWVTVNSNTVASWLRRKDKVEELQKLGVLPSPPACGIFRPEQYFNQERSTKSNEFPWVVTLMYLKVDKEFMGVFISKQYLLATTDLILSESRGKYEHYAIYMETCRTRECRKIYEVKYMGYSTYNAYITLLRLSQPIDDQIANGFQPICLPSTNERNLNYVGQHLLWTSYQHFEVRRLKHFVLIQPLGSCHDRIEFVMSSDFICANTCDNAYTIPYNVTGSILMSVALNNSEPSHYYLASIQHKLVNFCFPGQPQIFDRIDHLLNWIVESIEREENITSVSDP